MSEPDWRLLRVEGSKGVSPHFLHKHASYARELLVNCYPLSGEKDYPRDYGQQGSQKRSEIGPQAKHRLAVISYLLIVQCSLHRLHNPASGVAAVALAWFDFPL